MNEETAKAVYERALAFDPVIIQLREAVERVEDEGFREGFTKAIGDLMGLLYCELMYPIEKLYPNLIPERERPER